MPSQAKMDEIRRFIDRAVKEHGWYVQSVLPGPQGDPSFSYTIGMTETFGHPELLMIGFPPDLMHQLLNGVGKLDRAGERFGEWDQSDKVVEGFPVYFRAVPLPQARKWARGASERYRPRSFGLLQVFLPDRNGKFPWDEGCDPTYLRLQGKLLQHMKARH